MRRIINLKTGEEATDLGFVAPDLNPTPAEKEAAVQRMADEITANGDRDKAQAMATVDLVIAARDGTLNGMTRTQIRKQYRDRIVFYLRENRGL